MLTKILAPVDFSESSSAGLAVASELAARTGAELLVLHVDELPIMPVGEIAYMPSYVLEERRTNTQARLAAFVAQVERGGGRVRSRFEIGPAHSTILEVAKSEQPELIVMGTHGRRGFSHLVLGSVAERVARTSNVPVMTVKCPASTPAAEQTP